MLFNLLDYHACVILQSNFTNTTLCPVYKCVRTTLQTLVHYFSSETYISISTLIIVTDVDAVISNSIAQDIHTIWMVRIEELSSTFYVLHVLWQNVLNGYIAMSDGIIAGVFVLNLKLNLVTNFGPP